MALIEGASLGGHALHVVKQYAEENALARERANMAAGTEEFGSGCLRGRYNNLREIQFNPSLVVVPSLTSSGGLFVQRPVCRTNYLPNNTMVGATGSVLPSGWSIGTIPAGITVGYSASGTAVAADGVTVNYVDFTFSGTAAASGFLNLRPNAAVSTIAALIGQTWTASVYLSLVSGVVSGVSPTWQLQEQTSADAFLDGSNVTGLSSLTSTLRRYEVTRLFTQTTTAKTTVRWGHSIVSGTAYNYKIRIASPQLERLGRSTGVIPTASGAVTVLNNTTNVLGLPPDFTVSRATLGTRVNSSGLIEVGTTNLALQSEAFNVSGTWTLVTGGTGLLPVITPNSVVAPDGTTTADTVVFNRGAGNASSDFSQIQQVVNLAVSGTYTLSVYAKATTSGDVGKQFYIRAKNNLVSGSLTSSWVRYTNTETGVAAGNTNVIIGNRGAFTADNSVSVDLWGAQLEIGSTATEYIPTTTVARTRFQGVTVDGTIPVNIPRIDWLGQSCPALLVEPAATNFALNVSAMTAQDTPTASGGMTITTGSTDFTAPDGTSGTITKYVGGAASGNSQYAYYTGGGGIITVNASGQHTFSLFVKAGATNPLNFCALSFTLYTGGSGVTSYFSLASGTALTAGASIQNYGNGWYRLISAPYTIASGDLSGQVTFQMAEANNDSSWPASGALNLTAYTWGAQVEAGAVATTYIPTTTGAFTRNADTISASGALVSGLIGQTAGTIYAEVVAQPYNNSLFPAILQVEDGADSQRFALFVNASGGVRLRLNSTNNNISLDATSPTSLIAGQVYKIAAAFAFDGTSALYINGVFQASGSVASGPFSSALNRVNVGSRGGAFISPSRIRSAALYTTRLSNAQLAELTKL